MDRIRDIGAPHGQRYSAVRQRRVESVSHRLDHRHMRSTIIKTRAALRIDVAGDPLEIELNPVHASIFYRCEKVTRQNQVRCRI